MSTSHHNDTQLAPRTHSPNRAIYEYFSTVPRRTGRRAEKDCRSSNDNVPCLWVRHFETEWLSLPHNDIALCTLRGCISYWKVCHFFVLQWVETAKIVENGRPSSTANSNNNRALWQISPPQQDTTFKCLLLKSVVVTSRHLINIPPHQQACFSSSLK